MASKEPEPKTEPDAPPSNRAERRRRARGKGPVAPEARGSADPDARGVSPDQQRLSQGRR